MSDSKGNDDAGEKRPSAVALRYEGQGAPEVVAKGQGYVAEQIIALAEEHGIPLHEDANLVQLLAKLDLGQEIPTPLYQAVAEVLAWAYRLAGKQLTREKDV